MENFCGSIVSNPLFASVVTLYSLILLYLPNHFISIVFSPVLIITGALLLTLLRLGAIQRLENEEHKEKERTLSDYSGLETEHCSEPNDRAEVGHEQIASVLQQEEDHSFVTYQFETDYESEKGFDPNPGFEDCFIEWNVKAPLDVIYEEHEGEEDEVSNERQENKVLGLGRHPSLSLCYPESDSDTSSDGDFSVTGAWNSPEDMCYQWEDEDREGLIEIALDGNKRSGSQFQVEEDNLIEIDITPTRSDDSSGQKFQFYGESRFS